MALPLELDQPQSPQDMVMNRDRQRQAFNPMNNQRMMGQRPPMMNPNMQGGMPNQMGGPNMNAADPARANYNERMNRMQTNQGLAANAQPNPQLEALRSAAGQGFSFKPQMSFDSSWGNTPLPNQPHPMAGTPINPNNISQSPMLSDDAQRERFQQRFAQSEMPQSGAGADVDPRMAQMMQARAKYAGMQPNLQSMPAPRPDVVNPNTSSVPSRLPLGDLPAGQTPPPKERVAMPTSSLRQKIGRRMNNQQTSPRRAIRMV